MSKAKAADVAALARTEALEGEVSYADMDCQAWVEHVVEEAGGRMAYAGSNDMARNACAYLGTVAQARAEGRLVPGALLFIREEGGEGAKYQKDGLGNFSHVGFYCGCADCETADSSKSRGGVGSRRLSDNVWTHVGWAKEIDYASAPGAESGAAQSAAQVTATVVAPSGQTVNLRATASANAVVREYVPVGATVEVLGENGAWCRVRHNKTGWMQTRFLGFQAAAGKETEPEAAAEMETSEVSALADDTVAVDIPRDGALALYRALARALGVG